MSDGTLPHMPYATKAFAIEAVAEEAARETVPVKEIRICPGR